MMLKRFWWVAVLTLIADQASKAGMIAYLAVHGEQALAPALNLVLVHNTGAAFGFLNQAGGWQNLLFVLIAVVVSTVIIVITARLGRREWPTALALMLVLGGALGNLVDRVRLGYVVDFIDVYYRHWHWPAFNLADSAITLGAILLVLDVLKVGGNARGAHE